MIDWGLEEPDATVGEGWEGEESVEGSLEEHVEA